MSVLDELMEALRFDRAATGPGPELTPIEHA